MSFSTKWGPVVLSFFSRAFSKSPLLLLFSYVYTEPPNMRPPPHSAADKRHLRNGFDCTQLRVIKKGRDGKNTYVYATSISLVTNHTNESNKQKSHSVADNSTKDAPRTPNVHAPSDTGEVGQPIYDYRGASSTKFKSEPNKVCIHRVNIGG